MIVRGRSPVRICDIGGWTDTHFAEHGAVCNGEGNDTVGFNAAISAVSNGEAYWSQRATAV